MTAGTIICKCSRLKNHYISVISDRSRDLEVLAEFRYKFHYILLLVVVPLFIFGCCCPLCVMWTDQRDYQALEDDRYDVSEELVDALQMKRTTKYKWKAQVYYNIENIHSY